MSSPVPAEWLRRWLAGALAVLIVAVPIGGQSSSSSSSSSGQANGSAKTKAEAARKPTGGKTASSGAGRGSPGETGWTDRVWAQQDCTDQAGICGFGGVAPMAQQLATLRTPAAYAGVEKYAHQHDGEASSAAYLALDTLICWTRTTPRRKATSPRRVRLAMCWLTTRSSLARRLTTKRGTTPLPKPCCAGSRALSRQHLQCTGSRT